MNTTDHIFSVVKNLVLEIKDVDEDDITPETRIDSLDLDSLDFIELQVVIKKQFGATLDPGVFVSGQIATLSEMCTHIAELVAGATEAA